MEDKGIAWMWPPPSNSDHQDYYMFSRESQPKPSFTTGILGATPKVQLKSAIMNGRILR